MKLIVTAIILAAIPGGLAAAGDAKAGRAAYDKSCKSCHGVDGAPNAAIAKMMKVEMKDLKSAEVQALSDADLKKINSDGKGKMNPAKGLAAADADNVVAFVRSLKK